MKVLEIGTGSGYQTAILCQLGLRVFTIERHHALFVATRKRLNEMGFRVKCFLGDGYKGLTEADYGQFDRIIITCGAREIPPALMAQLKIGGQMIIPIGEETQEMLRITKGGDTADTWSEEHFGTYNFVPMLDGKNFG